MSILGKLYDHLIWADARAREEINAMAPGSPERARAEAIYAHIAGSEHNWFARTLGEPATHAIWPTIDLPTAARVAHDAADGLRALTASSAAGGAERQVRYRNSSGTEYVNRLEDILLHVAIHGAYHRGQLAQLARQSGMQPAMTDFIVFVRER